MASITPFLVLLLLTPVLSRTYIECSCSASTRGYRREVRDELRQDLRELTDLRNDLLIDQAQDPTITASVIEQRLKQKAFDEFRGCVGNFSPEECVNADAALRHREGNYRTSFCDYSRTTWQSGGKPSCDKIPGLASVDPDIIAGRPEILFLSLHHPPSPPPYKEPYLPPPTDETAPPGPPPLEYGPSPSDSAPVPPGPPPLEYGPSPSDPAPAPPAEGQPEPQKPTDALDLSESTTPGPGPAPAPICFPGGATVMTDEGCTKRMDQLVVSDRVAVGNGKYSEVFMFTHKLGDVTHDFVAINTASGASLRLTEGHYLPLNGVYQPARTAKVGDTVELADGTISSISQVSVVTDKGLFNPQTSHGDIIVDGVRTSTYTTAVKPNMAHALLAPLRLVCKRLRIHVKFLDKGADNIGHITSRFV